MTIGHRKRVFRGPNRLTSALPNGTEGDPARIHQPPRRTSSAFCGPWQTRARRSRSCAAISLTRERLEAAYEYLLEHPPLGLAIRRHRDELFLVTAPEVAPSVERHLGHPPPIALSRPATEVLAIVAYKQPIARSGIEHVRGTNSDSTLETLLMRGLVALDVACLVTTTRAFLDLANLRDLADLPPLVAEDDRQDKALRGWPTEFWGIEIALLSWRQLL